MPTASAFASAASTNGPTEATTSAFTRVAGDVAEGVAVLHADLHLAAALAGVVARRGVDQREQLLAAEHDADDEAAEHEQRDQHRERAALAPRPPGPRVVRLDRDVLAERLVVHERVVVVEWRPRRPRRLLGTERLLAERLLVLAAARRPRRRGGVLLDVGADDLETTGLVVPVARVGGIRGHRMRIGARRRPRGVRPSGGKSGPASGALSSGGPPRVGCATVSSSSA